MSARQNLQQRRRRRMLATRRGVARDYSLARKVTRAYWRAWASFIAEHVVVDTSRLTRRYEQVVQ